MSPGRCRITPGSLRTASLELVFRGRSLDGGWIGVPGLQRGNVDSDLTASGSCRIVRTVPAP
jgi:hypothetical protein